MLPLTSDTQKRYPLILLIFVYTISYTIADESLKILEWANNNVQIYCTLN